MADLLTLGDLVAATPQRQLYRATRGAVPWAVVILPQAGTSPPGWADRLRALCDRCASLSKAPEAGLPQNTNLVLFTETGSLSGQAAVGRRWVEGTSAWALGRGRTDGLPPLLALLALIDLAVCLDELHGAGLCHGGIGPEAAIVQPDGHLSLVDAGLGPALTGKAGSETADLRALGKLAYLWLTSREANLDPNAGMPPDFALPSRLDRRVPAQVDPLILRSLLAGGPRGLKQAKELVAGLRQVLRSAGAAVSPADLAQWVAKGSQAARVKPTLAPLLRAGPAQWEPLAERKIGAKLVMGKSAPGVFANATTLVDMPRVVLSPSMLKTAEGTGDASQASMASMASTVAPGPLSPRSVRRWMGLAGTAAFVVGALVIRHALAGRSGKHKPAFEALAPQATQDERVRERPVAVGSAQSGRLEGRPNAPAPVPKPLPEYQLPQYDPKAPATKKPAPPRVDRPASRLGRGAWLSLEASRVARVFVDGHDLQMLTPVQHLAIAPGPHRIRLVAAMGSDGSQEFEVDVKAGKTAYRFGKLDE